MAHSLGLGVLAEGGETAAPLDFLRRRRSRWMAQDAPTQAAPTQAALSD